MSSPPLPAKTSVPDSMLLRYVELLIHPRDTRSLVKSRMFSQTLAPAATRTYENTFQVLTASR